MNISARRLLTFAHTHILRYTPWHFSSSAFVLCHKIRLRLGQMFSIKNIVAGEMLAFLLHIYVRIIRVRVCVCVCSAPIHLVAPETNKAPNTHINVKYGRFNDTFWCRCGVYIGPNRAEFDAFGTDTATQLSLLRAHTEPRVTDTTIDEQHTHTPAAMGIYVF